MAITTLAGGTNASVRNETNINQAGSVPLVRYHHAQQIYWKNGDFAPFCQLCDALGKERGHDYRTIWKEDEAIPQADTLAGSAATDSTTVTVSNVAQWMPNDTLYVHSAGGAYATLPAMLGTRSPSARCRVCTTTALPTSQVRPLVSRGQCGTTGLIL